LQKTLKNHSLKLKIE